MNLNDEPHDPDSDGEPASGETEADFLNLVLAGLGTLILFYIVYSAYLTHRQPETTNGAESSTSHHTGSR